MVLSVVLHLPYCHYHDKHHSFEISLRPYEVRLYHGFGTVYIGLTRSLEYLLVYILVSNFCGKLESYHIYIHTYTYIYIYIYTHTPMQTRFSCRFPLSTPFDFALEEFAAIL